MANLTPKIKLEIILEVGRLAKKNFQNISAEKDKEDANKKLDELNKY